ncbi:predicted protein [Plenodomus lingam JN3]|uniref:Predicted protein n=1 Tax=Leptosphaeria maculans (strain JN3 / isolate v23.1.3 / race Av1-4-5-6-7-8) TaxID=985895 RepID=E4ZK40_LEPMJ|nr:predicted protein [Plenodomus lingam JN3]CBX91635.1 predicted protein [Plenodomus lingam JN3]
MHPHTPPPAPHSPLQSSLKTAQAVRNTRLRIQFCAAA